MNTDEFRKMYLQEFKPLDVDSIWRGHKAGLTVAAIAEAVGCRKDTVRRELERMRLHGHQGD